MAGTALQRRLTWQQATVVGMAEETRRVRTLMFDVSGWHGHLPGQHVDIRLTAEDGYQAQRSYSIASAPEDEHLALTVERLDDGEVSPYLVDELRPGDAIEVRGPIGGYFVWEGSLGGPLLLIAGGSGVAPFRSMIRHHGAVGSDVPVRLLYSAARHEDIIYRQELAAAADRHEVDVCFTLTRGWPNAWQGHRGRIDRSLLEQVGFPPSEQPRVYVCGPTGFVERAANLLVELGHDSLGVRTERFGDSSGGSP